MALTSAQALEQVATFFEDRVEVVELKNGGQAYIQRPKPKEAGIQAVSADDLPDDFTVDTISANSTELYRISFTPLEITFSFDAAILGVIVSVNLVVPILGPVSIGSVSGGLKSGIVLKIGYEDLAEGTFGAKLDDGKVILYWDFKAFGAAYADDLELFTL